MLIGIDLGTTNSLAGFYKDGEVKIIPNRLGEELTPSVVAINENDEVLVGRVALEYGRLHPVDCAKVFKRSMGTEKTYQLRGKKFNSTDLSSFVLRSLKEDAEAYLGCEVDKAIISVPAYFNDLQRRATAQAGALAGLEVVRIINEPSAAALAYGVGLSDKDEKCLVFDLGGGTLDVSILEYSDDYMEVHAIAGDNFTGGEDFTRVLTELFLKKAGKKPEILSAKEMNLVMAVTEDAKKKAGPGVFNISCRLGDELVEQTIKNSEFEEECEALKARIRKPIEKALKDSGTKLSDIDRVILVGGATKLGIVRNYAAKLFSCFPETIVDPDKAVAMGAAIACGLKERNKEIKEMVFVDVCPFTLGTEVCVNNGRFDEPGHYLPIIQRNTVIPVSCTQTVYTMRDDQSAVEVKVLQGESRMASNNLKLGELSIAVPPAPAGKESIDITYTYDINSILEVEVKVNSTGQSKKIVIQKGDKRVSEKEIEERFKELEYLKQNPRDEEPNALVLLRGERLYEEGDQELRAAIDREIMKFERALEKKDRPGIEKARRELTEFLDEIENNDQDINGWN
ncbi:Hsp70 family protein [Butyrivibrio sp. MC2021]|uniref:Hsp70 family protein n=1 Tax=Butyrivibrio sp. MC2021 TaxID=1408306 RepID=UPI000478B07B|nr:Hsp70 family protein [Butyrivibrio sp. MC2021]